MIKVIKKYQNMILVSLFFFYVGCGLTLSFLRIDCDASFVNTPKSLETGAINSIEYPVLVLTSPTNEAKRDAVRTTWANFANNIAVENGERIYKWNHTWTKLSQQYGLIKVFFVIGTQGLSDNQLAKLEIENNRRNDLVLLNDFEDSYNNLASKMLHALQWFSSHLKGLKYLIKCDDDSFVRIDLIVRDLEAYAPSMDAQELRQFVSYKSKLQSYKGLYWGYFDGRARVYLSGKWEEKDWFLCDRYLPYALGGGYVVSRSLVDYIAKNADFLSVYNSEDVSIGVWTAALSGVNRVHDIRFDTEWKTRGCNEDMLVRHKQTPSDMFQMYKTLVHSQGNRQCKTESSERQSYVYKWNVLPSVCCK